MVAWRMNELERFGRKRSWSNGVTIPTEVKGLRTVLPAEIREEYLSNTCFNINKLRVTLNSVLILIRPCATQSKFARFPCFYFLLYFTTCFCLSGHHQAHTVCLRSLLFPFEVLDASTCFVQVTLHHDAVPHAGKQSQIHGKHEDPSRAHTTPQVMKATYSTNINQTRG
jgi:hypothetical protein